MEATKLHRMIGAEKIDEMRRAYPALILKEQGEAGQLVWEGPLSPLRSIHELDAILDDLENDRDVQVVLGELAEIVHDSKCRLAHSQHRAVPLIFDPFQTFTIRVTDFGTDRQPEATIVTSPTPVENMRHRLNQSGICAYAPWKYPWHSQTSSIVDFTDQAFIWLLKQLVYQQTNVWLGSETPHEPEYLLKTLKHVDRCSCGSEKQYENCCRRLHAYAVYGDMWIQFEVWLSRVERDRAKRLEKLTPTIRRFLATK